MLFPYPSVNGQSSSGFIIYSATKRQLFRSVLFEAFFLSIIGIPLGILSGIAGIGITLKLTKNMFMSFLQYSTDAELDLYVSGGAVIAAVLIGLATVLISAFIPAKRGLMVSAIDAIRQTSDIKIKAGKVKTSKITYKLFGFEGMIARKILNVTRKVPCYSSFFMSVVCLYLPAVFVHIFKGTNSVIDEKEYDIVYVIHLTLVKSTLELYMELSSKRS